MKCVGASAATGLLTATALMALIAGCAGRPLHDAGEGQPPRYVGVDVEALEPGKVSGEMDRLAKLFSQQFVTELKNQSLQLLRLPGGIILLEFAGDAAFETGSAQLRASSLDFYSRLAEVVLRHDSTVLHIVAHTDGADGDDAGLSLSERRALSVAAYLEGSGVPATRLRHEGRGLREPLASNATAEGQRRNRRLDLILRPVIEGKETQAWMPPPYLGG